MAYLAKTIGGQAQLVWAGVQVLIRGFALRPRPATYGDLGRDRGMPEATRGLPQVAGQAGMPEEYYLGEALSAARAPDAPPSVSKNPAFGG